jgi:hypothetical protein
MKKSLLLLIMPLCLMAFFSGCARLSPELSGAGDAAQMAVAMGNFSGDMGKTYQTASSINAMAMSDPATTSDSEGWFTLSVTSDATSGFSGTFKLRYFNALSTSPLTGIINDVLSDAISHMPFDMEFQMSGTCEEGDFTMEITLSNIGILTDPDLSGAMTAEIAETGETASITFTDLSTDSQGVVNGGTISATYDNYAISLTYESDGSATGTLSLNGAQIATLDIAAYGSGTMTYEDKEYDLATGKPVDSIF